MDSRKTIKLIRILERNKKVVKYKKLWQFCDCLKCSRRKAYIQFKFRIRYFLILVAILSFGYLVFIYLSLLFKPSYNKPEDFEGFNNETGSEDLIVPNFVHFIQFEEKEFRFIDAICILAAVKNQRPDKLYIHTNVANFSGKYWDFLMRNSEFSRIYEIKEIDFPIAVFGQKFNPGWRRPHASDVERLKLLMKFGGIYLDHDTFVVQNLDCFRRFEMVLNWDDEAYLGTQTLIAHPKARFLPAYIETYRDHYQSEGWYYNAGERPTKAVLYKKPELVHRVKEKFGAATGYFGKIFKTLWPEWREMFTIHLLINHRGYMDKEGFNKTKEFDENNILKDNNTIGVMIKEILDWNKQITELNCPLMKKQ